jgi:hypothetical protein
LLNFSSAMLTDRLLSCWHTAQSQSQNQLYNNSD